VLYMKICLGQYPWSKFTANFPIWHLYPLKGIRLQFPHLGLLFSL